jgi:hypothetical protein
MMKLISFQEKSTSRAALFYGGLCTLQSRVRIPTIWHNAYTVEQGANDAALGSFPITLYIPDIDEKDNLLEDYLFDCNNLEEFCRIRPRPTRYSGSYSSQAEGAGRKRRAGLSPVRIAHPSASADDMVMIDGPWLPQNV